jgi:hypothetical protein
MTARDSKGQFARHTPHTPTPLDMPVHVSQTYAARPVSHTRLEDHRHQEMRRRGAHGPLTRRELAASVSR